MRTEDILALLAIIGMAFGLFVFGNAHADGAHGQGAKVTSLMRQSLQDLPGKEGEVVFVEFAPGYVDPPHRHDAHVFVYVLEGAIEMQVEGGKPVTLKKGDVFYENPTDIHPVGRNLSKTKPAKLLVFFVKKENVPFFIPVQP